MLSETHMVNELLAFIQNKMDVMDEISMMQICTSSFREDEIQIGKKLLYESVGRADRMPLRRLDEKGARSLQDIINLLKEVDPDDVPTFVAKDLQRLPPVTFDHVDVTRLLKDITSMKASLAEMQLKLEASQSTICELRSEVVDLRHNISECRSHEASNVNTRRGAFNASSSSFESAKLDSSPAAVGCNALPRAPRPACPASPVIVSPTLSARKSTPQRAYAAAVAKPAQQPRPQPEQVPTTQSNPAPKAYCRGRADKDGFVKVERKRKKPTCRNQCGTAPTGPNHLLRPAIPTTQLYVSRLRYSTKVEDVVEYIEKKTNFIVRVVKLESRHNVNFTSFVVRVPAQFLETFTKEEFWPKGVVFRRFRGTIPTAQASTSPSLRALV